MLADVRWATRRAGWLLAGLGALAMGWGGCGGKAVIDSGAGGGASSSSGSGASTSTSTSTSGSSTSTSTSTSTSGAGAGPGSLCMEACAHIDACLGGGNCTADCQAAQDQCVGQQDSYLMCVIDDQGPGQCGGMPACGSELHGLLACKGLASVGGTCGGGSGGDCSCSITDNQGNSYSTQCTGGGMNSCSCIFNGEMVGKCTFPGPPECDPFYDCCATLFFVPYLPGGMVDG